jgi:hypothetical protein
VSRVPLLQVGDRAVQSVGNATHLSLPPGTTGLQIACWCAPQSRSRLSRSVDATLCGAFHVCRLKGLNPATGPRLLREGGGLSVTLPAGCAPHSTSAPGLGKGDALRRVRGTGEPADPVQQLSHLQHAQSHLQHAQSHLHMQDSHLQLTPSFCWRTCGSRSTAGSRSRRRGARSSPRGEPK